MGCAGSKFDEDIEEGIASIVFLEEYREMMKSVDENCSPQNLQETILSYIDNELRIRFLDECVSTVKNVSSTGIIAKDKLPECISSIMDESLYNLCKTTEGSVNCYVALQNATVSSKLISYACDDAKKRFICRQFSDDKSNMSFLYDISSKMTNRSDVTDYCETFNDIKVTPIEKIILTSIPCLMEENKYAGNWQSVEVSISNTKKEEKKEEAAPVVEEEKKEEVKEEVVPIEEEKKEEVKEEAVPVVEEEKKEEVVPVVEEEKKEEAVPVEEEKKEEAVPVEEEKKEEVKEEAVPIVEEEKKEEAAPVEEKKGSAPVSKGPSSPRSPKGKKGKKGRKGKGRH